MDEKTKKKGKGGKKANRTKAETFENRGSVKGGEIVLTIQGGGRGKVCTTTHKILADF